MMMYSQKNRFSFKFKFKLALFLCLIYSTIISAHESRPALASFTETGVGEYDVLWKVPAKMGQKLDISINYPKSCKRVITLPTILVNSAAIEEYKLFCDISGLTGKILSINGLSITITDVLLRIETLEGQLISTVLTPENSSYKIPEKPNKFSVITSYGQLGFEHIIEGLDHLFFVLGLFILVSGLRHLLVTITSFTLAHSITLGVVSLGIVPHPGPVVEVIIALSILFLAVEIIKIRQGSLTITSNKTGAFAFLIGLLHGFGFAGALSGIGLPQGEIPLALLFFNIGIEVGQLSFIGLCFLLKKAIFYVIKEPPSWLSFLPVWGIGVMGAFWFFERSFSLF